MANYMRRETLFKDFPGFCKQISAQNIRIFGKVGKQSNTLLKQSVVNDITLIEQSFIVIISVVEHNTGTNVTIHTKTGLVRTW